MDHVIQYQVPTVLAELDLSTGDAGLLGAGEQFTGPIVDISGLRAISILARSDVASATNGLRLQQGISTGNIDDLVSQFTVNAGTTLSTFVSPLHGKLARIIYINAGVGQTSFRLYARGYPIA